MAAQLQSPPGRLTVYALLPFLLPLGIGLLPPLSRLADEALPGLAYLSGFTVALLALFLAGIAGVPLHFVAWALCIAAACGLVRGALRRSIGWRAVAHPLFVLPVGVACLVAASWPVTYEIYAWDAWYNWVGWARQIVVADALYRPDMWIGKPGDTPGWPLAMALPGLVGGTFRAEDAWSVAIALHIGLLAFFFDVARLTLGCLTGLDAGRIRLTAWVFVLAALAVELSWTLVPTLLLIEEPQYYVLAAGALALAAAIVRGRADALLLAAATLMMLAAYLFKSSFVAYAPSFLLFAGWLLTAPDGRWRGVQRAGAGVGTIAFALVGTMLVWKAAAPPGHCLTSSGELVARLFSDAPVHGVPFGSFAARVLGRMADFALTWKLPVTLAALGGIFLFVRHRVFLPVVAALTLMWVVFSVGMISGMAACFTASEVADLASVQRYARVPLRITQTVGAFMLLAAVAWMLGRLSPRLLAGRPAGAALCVLVGVLGVWQVDRSVRAIRHVEIRTNIDDDFKSRVRASADDARTLLARAPPPGRPVRILYFSPPPYVEAVAANYHGLGVRRGAPLRPLVASTRPLAPDRDRLAALQSTLGDFDAIGIAGKPGPRLLGLPEVGAALAGCTQGPQGYLLMRDPASGFVCRPRGVR